MKTRLLVLSLAVMLGGAAFGQQDKLLTHFIFDKMSLNPGSTGLGMRDGFCGTTVYRNQWDKVNGAPNSAILNIEGNLSRYFPGGFGLSFYHDAIGFTRQNTVHLNYSYPIDIPGAGQLGVGVGVGILNMGMNPDWVPPVTLTDPSLPTGFAATDLDFNFGLYFRGTSDYYVGISSTHLSATQLESNPFTFNSARHYYLMGGKKFGAIDGNVGDLDVNVLLRTELIKYSADINVRYIWDDAAYGGLTYRTSDAVAVMIGAYPFKLAKSNSPMDNLLIGYSYDITINKLSSISNGSHEILLRYCYYLPPIPIEKSKHPRWL